MRRLFVLGAVLASVSGVARGEDPRPAVFVRVDAVRVAKNKVLVSGQLEGGKDGTWEGWVADLTQVHPTLHTCTSMAFIAMQNPGKVKLEVSQPDRWHPSCGLLRVPGADEPAAARAP